MNRQRNQHTIAQSCQLSGRGYWTGKTVRLTFHPAGPCQGVRFIRTDLPGEPAIPANPSHRRDIDYRTVVGNQAAEVAMIEHVLAALYGLEIDNCTIEMDGAEVPGWDGSSQAVVECLRSAGLVMQAARRERLVIDRRMRFGGVASWIEIAPTQTDRLTVEYRLDYGPDSPIPEQHCSVTVTPESFCRELSAARTFVTAEQVAELHAQGVARHVQPDELLVFDRKGLTVGKLRWPNECARHKALDLVGDLALAGYDIVGRVTSHRGGHRLNAEVARSLKEHFCHAIACRRAA